MCKGVKPVGSVGQSVKNIVVSGTGRGKVSRFSSEYKTIMLQMCSTDIYANAVNDAFPGKNNSYDNSYIEAIEVGNNAAASNVPCIFLGTSANLWNYPFLLQNGVAGGANAGDEIMRNSRFRTRNLTSGPSIMNKEKLVTLINKKNINPQEKLELMVSEALQPTSEGEIFFNNTDVFDAEERKTLALYRASVEWGKDIKALMSRYPRQSYFSNGPTLGLTAKEWTPLKNFFWLHGHLQRQTGIQIVGPQGTISSIKKDISERPSAYFDRTNGRVTVLGSEMSAILDSNKVSPVHLDGGFTVFENVPGAKLDIDAILAQLKAHALAREKGGDWFLQSLLDKAEQFENDQTNRK